MNMKILFILKHLDFHPPMGVMQVSAMAKQKGHETSALILSQSDCFNEIKRIGPEMIAYSGATGEHKYYSALNKKIKQEHPEIFTIMGGPHVTFFTDFVYESGLDAICMGEGEYAFAELLEKLEGHQEIDAIANLAFPSGKKNDLRPLVSNLDDLPFPDRELFYREGNGQLTENGRSELKNFMIGRGCPYHCSYCFNHSFKQKYPGQPYIRRHSVDYVLEEIRKTREKYPLSRIKFYDDIFTFRADDWLEEFSEKYKKQIDIPYYCYTRADLLTEDMTRLLKASGCETIQMAVESVNDRIRYELLHRKMTREQMKQSFKLCQDYGIKIVTNYIVGLPTSSIQDDIDAVNFNIEAGIHVPEFPIFHPYPGTELGNLCVEKGWFDGDYDRLHISLNNRSPLNCFTEHEKDVQANINRLGPLASTFSTGVLGTKMPSITRLILDNVIYQKTSDLFAEIYSQHKWELYSAMVYPMNLSPEKAKEAYQKTLFLETFRRTDE